MSDFGFFYFPVNGKKLSIQRSLLIKNVLQLPNILRIWLCFISSEVFPKFDIPTGVSAMEMGIHKITNWFFEQAV